MGKQSKVRTEWVDYVKAHWGDLSTGELAVNLGISRYMVYICAARAGVTSVNVCHINVTEEHRDFVREHKDTMSVKDMADALRLLPANIRSIIREVSDWDEKDIAELRAMCARCESMKAMRQTFHCTSYAIHSARKRYGIPYDRKFKNDGSNIRGFVKVAPVEVEPVIERAKGRCVEDIEADLMKATDLKDIERYRRELSCALLKEDNGIKYNDYGD